MLTKASLSARAALACLAPSNDLHMMMRLLVLVVLTFFAADSAAAPRGPVKIGIIGLDTSHSVAFTKLINGDGADGLLAKYQVVAAYPQGSTTIPSSYERIPRYIEEVGGYGVEIVDSIEELLVAVDVVLLETNDGKPHLEQALQVIRAGKPVFVDKPAAASLDDVVAIYEAAEDAGVPLFSSSSLRYAANAQAIREGSVGDVQGAFAYSPAPVEPSHPDLYWYGIHGVEMLFTVMGTGCESVVRTRTEGAESVTCTWKDGRIGTFYGIRDGESGYGGTAFGSEGISEIGPYDGYEPLVQAILEFFESGDPPVSAEETIEIYAFMSAADESKRRGGGAVDLSDVLQPAREAARAKLAAEGLR